MHRQDISHEENQLIVTSNTSILRIECYGKWVVNFFFYKIQLTNVQVYHRLLINQRNVHIWQVNYPGYSSWASLDIEYAWLLHVCQEIPQNRWTMWTILYTTLTVTLKYNETNIDMLFFKNYIKFNLGYF